MCTTNIYRHRECMDTLCTLHEISDVFEAALCKICLIVVLEYLCNCLKKVCCS